MNEKTIQVNISGRVQRVGFRACVRRIAFDLHILGTVMNMPEGRVQIYATGDPIILEKSYPCFTGAPVHKSGISGQLMSISSSSGILQ